MSDARNTRATSKLDSSPQSNANANKMLMEAKSRHDNKKKDSESTVKNVFDEKTNFLQETINENVRTYKNCT